MQPYMCDYCGKKLKQEDDYGLKIEYVFPIHKRCYEKKSAEMRGFNFKKSGQENNSFNKGDKV